MSTTIDSLEIQISTSAGSSAANIEQLASALGRLKENGKLTTVVNNLSKLGSALDKLNSSANSLTGLDKVAKIGESLSGLSNFSTKGFNSTVSALGKLPKVLSGLDSEKIEELRTKMKKLADALDPLAKKINEISTGFSKLPKNVNSAVSATKKMSSSTKELGERVNATNLNMATMMVSMQGIIAAARAVADAMAKVIAQAIEWDGIQFRFGRTFGEDAEETYQYILKINDALGINIQQFMQYSSLYGSLLSGFGMQQEKVTTISIGLTELSYDIWAAYNDRFKTLEDASEAVRSAITGEIEPIRNAGIALTEASLQEYIDSTHLAGVSIEKLTEAQKSEVRYAAMVNAAMNQGIVGTYAKEMHTAEGVVRELSQSFKTLGQAFGGLFIPLLQKVVPYITAFVELITDAIYVVAKFFGIELFKIDWSSSNKGMSGLVKDTEDTTNGLKKAGQAAKKLQQYTMGFDELNVINPDKGSSGGGSGVGGGVDWGSGLDLDTLWDESIFAEASKRVDEIKAEILDFIDEWKYALLAIGGILTALAGHKLWVFLAGTGAGKVIGKGFIWLTNVIRALWGTLMGNTAAKSALTFLKADMPPIISAFSKVLAPIKALAGVLGLPVWATAVAVVTAIASVAHFLAKNWEKVVRAVKGFLKENIVPKLEKIKEHFDNVKQALDPIFDMFKSLGEVALPIVSKAFEILGGIIFSVVGGTIATAFNIFVGKIENMIQIFSGSVQVISGVIQLIVALFKGDGAAIEKAWSQIWNGVVDVIKGIGGLIIDPIVDFVKGIISWFTNLWDELVGHSIVPDMIDGIVDCFLSLPKRILGTVADFVKSILRSFKDLWSSIKSWFGTNVAPKFTLSYWANLFDVIRSSIATKLDAAWTAVKKFFSIEEWKKKVTDAIDTIKKNFKLPEFPKIKLSVTWNKDVGKVKKAIYQALGLEGWPNLKWSTYATGGMPSMGEMFIARESGPELVGKIGNRSTVANNDQIVTAVSQGVYSAVRAAMGDGGNGGNQNINVYLDSKQIHASVKRTDDSRGASIMGNQLGYLY